MLTFMDSPENMLLLTVWGNITGSDLDAMMDRLDGAMAGPDEVHVFVETQGIEGIELSAIGNHITRAMPYFAKLSRFGRVAIVADQAWIRALSRLESALLPGISYRVFAPDSRDEALTWVRNGAG